MCITSCFIHFKLDTTFHNTSITPFFLLHFVHSAHSSKHWHGSPFTGSPHHYWVRVEIITIYFSSHSFHPTLISTSLFNSIHHMAIWAGANDTMTVKVPVFEWGSLEATLYWCKEFQDLIELKGLDAAAKFTNANILTSSAGCEKWQQAWAKS
jgi:hypothetical protein